MLAPDDEFRLLLRQVQSGSHEAIRELIERYAPHIVRAVRRKLSKAIRAKFDSIDFAQAVWASFFAAPQKLVEFDRPEELIRYLAALAHNKVVDEIRRRMETDKYNVNREKSLDDSALQFRTTLAAHEPSPSEVAVADELWERLLQGKPERCRRIIELRRDGNTHQQIAHQLGLNERTVRRVIRRVFEEQVS
jgi:RNA polymerase sigma factor (sigma-70 family)